MFRRLSRLWSRGVQGESAERDQSADPGVRAATGSPGPADTECLELWSTMELAGRSADVFEPQAASQGCVIFLHGHGQISLKDNVVFSRLFADNNLTVVCPDGGRSWWLDRICSDFDAKMSPQQWLVESLLPAIEERWQASPPGIALLGVSMGGQGALQLSYRQASQFPVVSAISPAVDFHQLYGHGLPLDEMFQDAEDARQATVVLNLHPLAWPRYQWFCCDPEDTEWYDGAVRLGMKLSSSGILHERDLETSGGGHSWEYFNRMAPAAVDHIVRSLRSA